MTKPNSNTIKMKNGSTVAFSKVEGKDPLRSVTKQDRPQLSGEMEKRFKDTFLMKGSDCTWKVYPDPEEVMEHLATAIEDTRLRYVKEIESLMDAKKAKLVTKTLYMFFGTPECKICGSNPEKQREMILSILKKEKQV